MKTKLSFIFVLKAFVLLTSILNAQFPITPPYPSQVGNYFVEYNQNKQILRYGNIKISNDGYGFILYETNNYHDIDWGGHWYGLSMGDPNKMYFNIQRNSSNRFPVSFNGFYGIGFRTSDGNMALLQNGILTIGLDNAKIVELCDNPSTNPFKLYVKSGIRTEQAVISPVSSWSDFVFDSDYNLMNLYDLNDYVFKHHHLPDIPSEIEIKKQGLNLIDMDKKLLQKIEELTLYILQLNSELDSLKK